MPRTAAIGTIVLLSALLFQLPAAFSDGVNPEDDGLLLIYVMSGCEKFYLDLAVRLRSKHYDYLDASGAYMSWTTSADAKSSCNKKRVGAAFLIIFAMLMFAGLIAGASYGILKWFA
ncbi:MAG: hypothetical protein MHMPM18_001273 [Marteilia pararefringens]